MARKEELNEIFNFIDENEKKLIHPLLDEVINLEDQMMNIKRYPFIVVNPKNSNQQKITPAAKLYKECSQSYMNAIRILINVLRKTEGVEINKLLERLEKFS